MEGLIGVGARDTTSYKKKLIDVIARDILSAATFCILA